MIELDHLINLIFLKSMILDFSLINNLYYHYTSFKTGKYFLHRIQSFIVCSFCQRCHFSTYFCLLLLSEITFSYKYIYGIWCSNTEWPAGVTKYSHKGNYLLELLFYPLDCFLTFVALTSELLLNEFAKQCTHSNILCNFQIHNDWWFTNQTTKTTTCWCFPVTSLPSLMTQSSWCFVWVQCKTLKWKSVPFQVFGDGESREHSGVYRSAINNEGMTLLSKAALSKLRNECKGAF